jgi:hypothetical protein
MPRSRGEHYVSIAGTVIDGNSGEIVPGARVCITQAPVAFIVELMVMIQQAIATNSRLTENYAHLFQHRPITPETLKTAQIILNALCRSKQFLGYRPDETVTGGDGHYCFYDLPAGHYGITAEVARLDHRYGIAQDAVRVEGQGNTLAFSQLDLEMSLMSPQPASVRIPAVTSVEAETPLTTEQIYAT